MIPFLSRLAPRLDIFSVFVSTFGSLVCLHIRYWINVAAIFGSAYIYIYVFFFSFLTLRLIASCLGQ